VGTEEKFGPMRENTIGEWRKLHVEELRYLYHSLNIIRIILSGRDAGYVARMAKMIYA
jgi:hypothetical protein